MGGMYNPAYVAGYGDASYIPYAQSLYIDTASTLRRMRPYYAPSYSTYPPSIMNPTRTYRNDAEKRYPIALRMVIKMAEVILGAAILGLVLGPMHNYSFYVFVTTTKTEWQSLVVGVVSCFAALALIMLATSCLAHEQRYWQKIDYFISIVGTFGYLLAGAIEAYFAACYPPTGGRIGYVCHRAEWIIATERVPNNDESIASD
uniref:MARVEL domain-containing protein n=1 Tax=Parascaris univalens TaxID=6257 RepID=A0A915CD89_PARUN